MKNYSVCIYTYGELRYSDIDMFMSEFDTYDLIRFTAGYRNVYYITQNKENINDSLIQKMYQFFYQEHKNNKKIIDKHPRLKPLIREDKLKRILNDIHFQS